MIYYSLTFSNFMQVKTTHYLCGTAHPQWESRAQFLVGNFTQVSLSFVVCSWSPNTTAVTDLLGLATFRISQVLQKLVVFSSNKKCKFFFI
jgi:hypothetical protein